MGEDAMTDHTHIDAATQRVLDTIENDELAARYPDGAHFIAATNPAQGKMATRALFAGEPVVIVYKDGHEMLLEPEKTRGLSRLLLRAAGFLSSRKNRNGTMQLPPGARIEARDSTGHPLAA